MREHDIDPDPFLVAVHDIDMTHIDPDPTLAARISSLPGRRIVYTNGSAPYAERVLERRGLSGLFDAIYGVEHAGFAPKPARNAFETIFALDRLDTASAAMFEDDPRNLAVPHEMGMRTVHVAPERLDEAHIHHHTDDLAAFLARLI
jgi:putative hydrolase of the HAD superfamily